jgi:hypothetical protein
MTSMNELDRRLAALEKRMNADRPSGTGGPFRILLITGGLPGRIKFAYADDLRWERQAEESIEQFAERAACAAKAEGATSLNIGGLRREGDEMYDGYPDFESWWAAEAAPDYPEVPPFETQPAHRSRLGYVGD